MFPSPFSARDVQSEEQQLSVVSEIISKLSSGACHLLHLVWFVIGLVLIFLQLAVERMRKLGLGPEIVARYNHIGVFNSFILAKFSLV